VLGFLNKLTFQDLSKPTGVKMDLQIWKHPILGSGWHF
jgi:hypothetical protein